MQGRAIDMEKLARANELMPAIGNLNVNARGDELGPGGQIIRKREDVVAEYYQDHPESKPTYVPQPAVPTVTVAPTVSTPVTSQKKKAQEEE